MKRKKLLTIETELSDPLPLEREICMNPWNGVCENTDIVLYIHYHGENLPICRECWEKIALKMLSGGTIEWSS